MLIQNATGTSLAIPPTVNGSSGSPASPDFTPASGNGRAEIPQVVVPPVESMQTAKPTDAQLQSAIDKLNQAVKQINTNLEFSIDRDTKRTLVKVVDTQTGETIKQIPSEEAIAISKAIDQLQKGLLFRQRA